MRRDRKLRRIIRYKNDVIELILKNRKENEDGIFKEILYDLIVKINGFKKHCMVECLVLDCPEGRELYDMDIFVKEKICLNDPEVTNNLIKLFNYDYIVFKEVKKMIIKLEKLKYVRICSL